MRPFQSLEMLWIYAVCLGVSPHLEPHRTVKGKATVHGFSNLEKICERSSNDGDVLLLTTQNLLGYFEDHFTPLRGCCISPQQYLLLGALEPRL